MNARKEQRKRAYEDVKAGLSRQSDDTDYVAAYNCEIDRRMRERLAAQRTQADVTSAQADGYVEPTADEMGPACPICDLPLDECECL